MCLLSFLFYLRAYKSQKILLLGFLIVCNIISNVYVTAFGSNDIFIYKCIGEATARCCLVKLYYELGKHTFSINYKKKRHAS